MCISQVLNLDERLDKVSTTNTTQPPLPLQLGGELAERLDKVSATNTTQPPPNPETTPTQKPPLPLQFGGEYWRGILEGNWLDSRDKKNLCALCGSSLCPLWLNKTKKNIGDLINKPVVHLLKR